MSKAKKNALKELNALPEFFHHGVLCVNMNGRVYEKESVIKAINLWYPY